VRLIYATIRAMLYAAVDDGLLLANPAAKHGKKLKLVKSKEARRDEIKAMTREQLDAFLAAARDKTPRYYPLLLTLARSGLRLGEARALQWDDLDLKARTVRVERTAGDDSRMLGTPKSGHGRPVDLSPQLADALRRLEVERKAETLRRGWRALPTWVFPNSQGDILDSDKVRAAFKRALRAAGLPLHFSPHGLRHTYASILISEGVSPAYVQRQLGHSTYILTVDTYGSWLPMGNKDVDRLDGPSGSKVVATAIAGGGGGGEQERQVCQIPSSSARPSSPSTPRGAATSGCPSSTSSGCAPSASRRTG
jgi:integrase